MSTQRPFHWQTVALLTLCQATAFGQWRTYEVYQPTVTLHDVIAAAEHTHKYNHCSTIAWFQDRWFCLWGSNTHPDEHAPGQRIVVSTSRDGRSWTPIEQPFSSDGLAENPVRYPEGKGHQWQPNLGAVDGELWAVWNQGGSAHDFRSPQAIAEDLRGLYFSRLKTSTGRWINRRLLWDGQAEPSVEGVQYHIASTQDLCQLRSGRVLAPVTLYAVKGRAEDAPPKTDGWWATAKRNAVIYTDDHGQTWRLSSTTAMPGYSWIQWEPTVWERPDGTVMMFSRNNTQREKGHSSPTSGEYLLWSMSRDGGQTWTAQQYVPVESVCSRMHAAPLDGRGLWEPARPRDDYVGRRYVMGGNPNGKRGLLYPQLSLPLKPNVFTGDRPLPADGNWHYLGLTVNAQSSKAVFYVDGEACTVSLPAFSYDILQGATAHIGNKRPAIYTVDACMGRVVDQGRVEAAHHTDSTQSVDAPLVRHSRILVDTDGHPGRSR